jgi:3-isopropylmalate dehydrogenase
MSPEGRFAMSFRIADPTATILSVALLLNHCGLSEEASRIERAVITDIGARQTGQARTTTEIGDAIASAV